MTRIAEKTRTGTATRTYEYSIGYHACAACKVETPDPPQSVLDDMASRGNCGTIWPGEHWDPPGWMRISEYGDICDRCARAVIAMLNGRSAGASLPSDIALLELNTHHALELATSGLLTNFPPAPVPKGPLQGYSPPENKRRVVYSTYQDYRFGEMRNRIRQIHNVLLGLPADHGDEP